MRLASSFVSGLVMVLEFSRIFVPVPLHILKDIYYSLYCLGFWLHVIGTRIGRHWISLLWSSSSYYLNEYRCFVLMTLQCMSKSGKAWL